MRVYQEELSDVSRYIENHKHDTLQEKEPQYQNILKHVAPFIQLGPHLRMLEVGTGTGWFPILCKREGLDCRGLEISPQLVEFAREYGRANGVEADIQLGNIEETDLGEAQFDVIIASSVFEHIENWRLALGVLFRALRPGGVLFFESTNKFGLNQGEYPQLFFYGWLPDAARYRFRMMVQGRDIMKNGIDFHQFRYGLLRRAFREAGFSRCMDRYQVLDPESKTGLKRFVFRLLRSSTALRRLALVCVQGTTFVCVK
jgi:2-polyprenyl-3-methyl-5-hydroxy-6-metoxy-1,4-benzoquinol methylase